MWGCGSLDSGGAVGWILIAEPFVHLRVALAAARPAAPKGLRLPGPPGAELAGGRGEGGGWGLYPALWFNNIHLARFFSRG